MVSFSLSIAREKREKRRVGQYKCKWETKVIARHEFLLPPPSNLVLYKQTDQYPVNIQHQQGFVFTSLLKIYAITAFLNYPRIYNKILVSSQGYFMLSVNHLIFPYQIITIASIWLCLYWVDKPIFWSHLYVCDNSIICIMVTIWVPSDHKDILQRMTWCQT